MGVSLHELSIVSSVVNSVIGSLEAYAGARVIEARLRVGALAAVDDSLLFNSADAAVITKMDIAGAVGFDRESALRNIRAIRPGIRILEASAKTGVGMDDWLGCLAEERGAR
jgi:hypothetical protein